MQLACRGQGMRLHHHRGGGRPEAAARGAGRVSPTRAALRRTRAGDSAAAPYERRAAGVPSAAQQQPSVAQQPGAAAAGGSGGVWSDEASAVAALSASIAVGALLGGGAGVGLDDALPESVQHISAALGWAYFTCWSMSFWPQIIENQRTRDVSGLSADYLAFSLVGFIAYSLYTGALYFSDDVRASYAALHSGALPDVSAADFAFAAHAVGATLIVAWQYVTMRAPGARGISPLAGAVCGAAALACAAGAARVGVACDTSDCAAWLPLLALLGSTKVAMTLIKYTPQVLHNHARRSTQGWNLTNVLLDCAGGALSFSQVALDAVARHDLGLITSTPAKFAIAGLSIGYDLVFVAQHYWAYKDGPGGGAATAAGEERGAGPVMAAVPVPVAPAGERARGEQPRPRSGVRTFAERARRSGGSGGGGGAAASGGRQQP
ncbi:MAG: PQ loop repeat-domain-containing protein [Monoraphidium minutum]|nr:MAG: PQ loop repeat-domain-containing protein [Monoraphidium minutum]